MLGTMLESTDQLGDPDRLRALDRSLLLDSAPEVVFDLLTELACETLSVPVALVSLVDEDRQFFKSCAGLVEPWASRRGTDLSHSFCQYVVDDDAALVVEDARREPRVAANLAIPDLNVVAYAGMPLHGERGQVLGSFCAIDSRPRAWTERELVTLRRLADVAEQVIHLRQRAFAAEAQHAGRFRRESQQRAIETESNVRLQRGLLPRELDGALAERVTSTYRPGSERALLGGDFADVYEHEDGTIDFVVGDVCGHSPEAAALAVALRSSWSALQPDCPELHRVAARLNAMAFRERSDPLLFVTVLLGRIAAGGARFTGLSAGHPRPLALNDGGVRELALPSGLPLGIDTDETWTAETMAIEGCELLAFTDGLVEGRLAPDASERFGVEQLILAIDRVRAAGDARDKLAPRLLEVAIIAHGGPLPDDVAILHIRPPDRRRDTG